jgi:hypothetical protein
MHAQNEIKRTLKQVTSIEVVRGLLAQQEHKTRRSIAESVCQHFGFLDAQQRAQIGGCVKALRELERSGHFVLPAVAETQTPRKALSPRRLDQPVALALDVPAQVADIAGLALIIVDNLALRRVWNELMLCEHPQGAGPLVGAQMRYLIGSEHGYLGGFGFGASALHLADRDTWIGWDSDTRRKHLNGVIGMSRFLIRNSVSCQNLASHVLGMVLRRVGADYDAQYGYRPWLVESFVDTENFIGTSYRAANWLEIGKTKGRGRQDRANECAKSVKAIYVYELDSQVRASMVAVAKPVDLIGLEFAQGLDGHEWASHEFGGADLGDKRANDRLIGLANTLGAMPGRAFCGAAQGDRAAIKSYYRMMEQPDDSQITMAAILAPHNQRTAQRMKAQSTVLCIQDGTDLNYSRLVQCDGLGVIGINQTGAKSTGLHLHTTLALTTEGLPLGILAAQCSAPAPRDKDDLRPASAIPIEEKKTFAWIEGLRQCNELVSVLPDTRQVCVMDREADFFGLFDEQRQHCGVELLVRAKHDRASGQELNLFEYVRQDTVQGQIRLNVPRQSARAKKSKQKASPGHVQRTAVVDLRYREVEFRPSSAHPGKKPLKLWVVHARESSSPADAEPVEWFLLTTIEVTTPEQAQECLRWYSLRWRIEDWHRVLKSGCRIEALQHKTAERLKRAIAINMVIAWRIMLMTLLGRECPDLPAEVLFSNPEIEVLQAYSKKTTCQADEAR